MKNQLIYRLFFIFSLFFLGAGNQLLAAAETEQMMQQSMQVAEKINLNTATAQQLAVIKGIGEKKAQAIIDYRETNGDFADLSELVNVKGIGESTLTKIQPFVTL
ncbi:ComEA family DNA-binding protein [Psychromonas sp.]|uniref:ComEA family DNA-binding protein n=1 Tax=Psychromonas sp. TaxID=1884585 RepID=UPI00356B13AF